MLDRSEPSASAVARPVAGATESESAKAGADTAGRTDAPEARGTTGGEGVRQGAARKRQTANPEAAGAVQQEGAQKGPGGFRVVVESPGTCDGELIRTVTQFAGRSQREVARCFFQAPGELVGGLDRETAEGFARTLSEAGARARVLDPEAGFEPGVGEWEAAVVVRDLDRIPGALHEVVRLLQVPPEEGIEILCRTPAVLMGSLSWAAAEAIQRRFATAGAEVDLSRPEQAIYDLYVDAGSEADRRRVETLLDRSSSDVTLAEGVEGAAGMVASGLRWSDLEPIRDELLRHASGVKVLNRDFARFDLTLTAVGARPEAVTEYLAEELGLPRRILPRMLEALPVVVAGNVRAEEAERRLPALEARGASATANLLSWRSFSLVLRDVGDRERAEEVLRLLNGLSREDARVRLAERPPVTFPGPFGLLRARWLQRELGKVGAEVELKVS